MDFKFLKYQGDQLFHIVVSVFLEINMAALRIHMGLRPHKVPSSGFRRGLRYQHCDLVCYIDHHFPLFGALCKTFL